MEGMLKDRREWVTQFKQDNCKLPDEIKPFYDRFNREAPLSPEEEEAKRLEEEEAKDKKKKKEKKKEKKKKGKKGKKDDDDAAQIIKIGVSEVIQKFDEHYDDYNESWMNRDESENYKQQCDLEVAKTEVMPML